MRILLLLVLFPYAAFANALETDFGKIFEDNILKLSPSETGHSLELPNKILISRNVAGEFLALDGSPHEALGCVLRLTLQSTAVTQLCPDSATSEQTEILQSNIANFATFYSENNVPKNPVEDVRAEMDGAISSLKERLQGLECSTGEVDKFKEFLAALISEDSQIKLAASFADARLPVMQPCL